MLSSAISPIGAPSRDRWRRFPRTAARIKGGASRGGAAERDFTWRCDRGGPSRNDLARITADGYFGRSSNKATLADNHDGTWTFRPGDDPKPGLPRWRSVRLRNGRNLARKAARIV